MVFLEIPNVPKGTVFAEKVTIINLFVRRGTYVPAHGTCTYGTSQHKPDYIPCGCTYQLKII